MATEIPDPKIPVDDLIRQLKYTLADKGTADGVRAVLDELQKQLPPRSRKFDTLIILEGRYKDLKQREHRQVISPDDLHLELNKLGEAVLDFLNHLQADDFAEPQKETQGSLDARVGKVLYVIPPKMQVKEEVECRVWIAFDLESLELELASVAEKELRDVRVADVMGVELFAHGKEEAFEIITYDEQIQKIEAGLSTQWTFFVTPLKEGKFPLILKISVVLVDENNEKIFKTVVLREIVQITTTAPGEAETKVLAKEARQFNFLLIPAAGAGGAGAEPAGSSTDVSGGLWQNLPVAAKALIGAAAAFLVGLFFWWAAGAGARLEKAADRSAWETASRSGDTTLLKDFIAGYPDSKYIPYAEYLLVRMQDSLAGFSVSLDDVEEDLPDETSDTVIAAPVGESPDVTTLPPPQKPAAPPAEEPASNDETQVRVPEEPAAPVEDIAVAAAAGAATAGAPEEATPGPETPEPETQQAAEPERVTDYKYAASKPLHPDCADKREDRREICTANRIIDEVTGGLKQVIPDKKNNWNGKSCVLTFVISKTGGVTDIKVVRTDSEDLSEAVKAFIQDLPTFIPGMNSRGEHIDVRYKLPVKISDPG